MEEKQAKEEDDPNFGEGLGDAFLDGSDAFDLESDLQCLDFQVEDAKLGLLRVRQSKKKKKKKKKTIIIPVSIIIFSYNNQTLGNTKCRS